MNYTPSKRSALVRGTVVVLVVALLVAAAATVYFVGIPGALGPFGGGSSSSTPTSLTPVSWILDFTPAGHITPLYAAIDKGYFSQQGISMNVISNPQGSAGAIQAVAAGKAQFGDADLGTLLNAMAKGNVTNVKMIGAYKTGGGGAGVIYLQGKGINSPKDLQGKTIGSFTGNSDETLFALFAKNTGINTSTISIQHVSTSALEPGLLSGKFDAILYFKQHLAELVPLAQKDGMTVGFFDFQDYGMKNLLQLSIIASTDVIQNNPSLVSRVLTAFYQGVQYSLKNPQDAAQSVLKQTQGLDYNTTLSQWQIQMPYIGNLAAKVNYPNPLMIGWMDPAAVSATLSIIGDAYHSTMPPAASVYTNQFVVQPKQ